MKQQSTERVLPSGRTAVDPDSRDVVPGIPGGNGLVPKDSIRKAGITEVLPRNVVKSLRTIRGPHPIDLHDDKTNLSLGHHARVSQKRFRNERTLRSGIDVFD